MHDATAAAPNGHQVQDACSAALASHRAYSFLLDVLHGLPDGHPRRGAVADTAALLHAGWLDQVGTIGRLTATCQGGLLLKAAVVSRLIERDEHDAVIGGPALHLAASLAEDILARP